MQFAPVGTHNDCTVVSRNMTDWQLASLLLFVARNQMAFSLSVQWELHVVLSRTKQSNHSLLCEKSILLCLSCEDKNNYTKQTVVLISLESLMWQNAPMLQTYTSTQKVF